MELRPLCVILGNTLRYELGKQCRHLGRDISEGE